MLVLLGQSLVVVGPELGDAVEPLAALAAIGGVLGSVSSLADILDDNLGSRSPDFSDLVGLSVIAESASVSNSLHHLW